MSNTIIELKYSKVAGNRPATLANGEISINTADGRFYYKKPSGVIESFDRYPGPSGLNGELQFNDLGELGASANLSFNKSTGVLTISGGVNVDGLNIKPAINTIFNHANAAFDKANSIPITNSFATIIVNGREGSNTLTALSNNDSLILAAGDGISLFVDPTTNFVAIATLPNPVDAFVEGADFGLVTEISSIEFDLGLITDGQAVPIDLGSFFSTGPLQPSIFVLPTYTSNTLPSATIVGQMILITDGTGGTIPSFSDGTNWRKLADGELIVGGTF